MKKVLIALLCVLLVLCFVSCGGNKAGGNPTGGPVGANVDTEFSIDEDGAYFTATFDNGDKAVMVVGAEDPVLKMVISYRTTGVTEGYFDKAMIQGAETSFDNSLVIGEIIMFIAVGADAGDLDTYLSPASTWNIDFTSETDPSRNVSFTVASEYVTQIKAYVNNWTPPAGE